MLPTPTSEKALSQGLLDALIRAGLIAVLVISCYQIFHPFLDLILWSLILAITLYPLQRGLKRKLGNKEGHTATLIVLIAIVILMVPIYLVGSSMVVSVEHALTLVKSGGLHVPPPAIRLPVGRWWKPLYDYWLQAATIDWSDASSHPSSNISLILLGKLAGFGIGLLMFMFALIIAGIFMAYGESGSRPRCEPPRASSAPGGDHKLPNCTATIRAVAQGSASPSSRCC
jgi:predicted PurR-regulated permease PerM